MLGQVELIMVKPVIFFEDVSVEIEPEKLGIDISSNLISPIRFELLSKESRDRIENLKFEVFKDIADSAISIEWKNQARWYLEDSITVYGFPRRRDKYKEVDLNDNLFFMTKEAYEAFDYRFTDYKEEFNSILEEILYSYDSMIEESLDKICNNNSNIALIKDYLRKQVINAESFKSESIMECSGKTVSFKESDDIFSYCYKEAIDTANTIAVSSLFKEKNKFIIDSAIIDKAIVKMGKCNVKKNIDISNLINDFKQIKEMLDDKKHNEKEVNQILTKILEESSKLKMDLLFSGVK
ncbi:hypothetical protein MKZ01_11545 [Lysinibacillus endophyticus]|uniref:hypothetical protein n=1 Tax=Ureibacillus endophyticus TaxID=1978490 RepID=UPI0031355394